MDTEKQFSPRCPILEAKGLKVNCPTVFKKKQLAGKCKEPPCRKLQHLSPARALDPAQSFAVEGVLERERKGGPQKLNIS